MTSPYNRDRYREGTEYIKEDAKWTFWKIFLPILGLIIILAVVGYVLGWFGQAGKVAKDEFGPKAALQKYEWFIDQAQRIDKMKADITLFENRLKEVDTRYASYGSDPSKWPIDIRTTYNREKQQAKDDLIAVVSQHNNLVKDYNAASHKFNWSPFKTKPDKPWELYEEYVIK